MAKQPAGASARRAHLRKMLTIRRAEEKVMDFASRGAEFIRGHYHVYIGQEASGVAACNALGKNDYVFTTHRNHGHVIARGGELGPVLAEIVGRTDGYNGGRGGTFHVIAPHLGILQTSGVVGGCMPLAVGAAFSIKKRGTKDVSLVFFGDGVVEEGAFWEAVNMASLWKLPVVFVCENNDVDKKIRKGGKWVSDSLAIRQLTDAGKLFGIKTALVDGCDMDAAEKTMARAVADARAGKGPQFVESRITRWPGNYGAFPVLHGGAFSIAWIFKPASAPKELRDWLTNSDPVSLYARKLVRAKVMTPAQIETMDSAIRAEVEKAGAFAAASPPRKGNTALEHVFA